MNLNSINYESVNEDYDPGYVLEHESVSDIYVNQNVENSDELNKLMLLSVYSALDNFDNKNDTTINPYKDVLQFQTHEGTIEIPTEVQKAAILQWTNLKNKNKNEIKKTSVDMVDSLFQFLFCILIIFTLLYTLSLFRKGVIKF